MDSKLASLFAAVERGEAAARDVLFAELYAELHRLARRQLSRRGARPSLSTTTLLHEAYLEISTRDGVAFPERGHFMAYAARVMRGLIVDDARRRMAHKRGGLFELTSLEIDAADVASARELTEISEALDELAAVEPVLAETVDLKFFCGFSFGEIAAMRGVSTRTIQRQWERARIWLFDSVRGPGRRALER